MTTRTGTPERATAPSPFPGRAAHRGGPPGRPHQAFRPSLTRPPFAGVADPCSAPPAPLESGLDRSAQARTAIRRGWLRAQLATVRRFFSGHFVRKRPSCAERLLSFAPEPVL